MARNLSPAVIAELSKGIVRPAIFVKLDWPTGAVYAWSGSGPFTWGGNTFVGVGDFGRVSDIPESSDGQATGIQLTLSGVPSELIATVIGDNYRGRNATLWLGFMNDGGALITDPPYERFSGPMSTMRIIGDGKTRTIVVDVESEMAILRKSNGRKRTHQDQILDHPSDLGLEYVESINQDVPDNWGTPGAKMTKQYGSVSGRQLL